MSLPSSAEGGVYVRKPKANIYTALLFVSLVALGIGIFMLCKEMDRYEWKFRKKDLPSQGAVPPPAASLDLPAPTQLFA